MPFAITYRQSKEKIGRLSATLTFLTPISTRTAAGGEAIEWAIWRSTKGMVDNERGSETTQADRPVALNTKKFTCRAMALPGVNEKMLIQVVDPLGQTDTYDIERIDYHPDMPNRMYREITATRHTGNVATIEYVGVDDMPIQMDWAQPFANQTGASVTVTAGDLLDTDDYTAAQINQLLFVFRAGSRMVYGESGSGGYTIDNANNRIGFNFSLAGENVLVHQYAVV